METEAVKLTTKQECVLKVNLFHKQVPFLSQKTVVLPNTDNTGARVILYRADGVSGGGHISY